MAPRYIQIAFVFEEHADADLEDLIAAHGIDIMEAVAALTDTGVLVPIQQVCAAHPMTTVELTPTGVFCAMCALDQMADLDARAENRTHVQ